MTTIMRWKAAFTSWLFGVEFFLRTGCTISWVRRVWYNLVERDIHPDEEVLLVDSLGSTIAVSAYGQQLKVRTKLMEFTINFSEESGLYVHERNVIGAISTGTWETAFRERKLRLFSTRWVFRLKQIESYMAQIPDRSGAMVTA